jgi:hypothetical protein
MSFTLPREFHQPRGFENTAERVQGKKDEEALNHVVRRIDADDEIEGGVLQGTLLQGLTDQMSGDQGVADRSKEKVIAGAAHNQACGQCRRAPKRPLLRDPHIGQKLQAVPERRRFPAGGLNERGVSRTLKNLRLIPSAPERTFSLKELKGAMWQNPFVGDGEGSDGGLLLREAGLSIVQNRDRVSPCHPRDRERPFGVEGRHY